MDFKRFDDARRARVRRRNDYSFLEDYFLRRFVFGSWGQIPLEKMTVKYCLATGEILCIVLSSFLDLDPPAISTLKNYLALKCLRF